MQKVIVLSPVEDFTSGAARGILASLTHLKKTGYEPVLITPRNGKLSAGAKQAGISIRVINFDWWARPKYGRHASYETNATISGQALVRMVELIQKEKPLACMTCTIAAPWLAYASAMTNTPHVWQVYEHVQNPSPTFNFRLGLNDMLKNVDDLSDKVFAVSESVKQTLSSVITNPSKLQVMYPYIPPLSERKSAASLPKIFSDDAFKLVILGNIEENKGQLDAVKAAAQLVSSARRIELALIGGEKSPAYVKQIRKVIKDNRLEKAVKLTGFVNNPQAYAKAADISLSCSERDAFPLAVVESMQLGVPVIASRSGGTQEIIQEDGLYGYLYDYGDADGLAKKIGQAMDNPIERKAVGRRGAKRVKHSFSSSSQVHKPLTTYLGSLQSDHKTAQLELSSLSDLVTTIKAMEHKQKLTQDYVQYLEAALEDMKAKHDKVVYSKRWQVVSKLPPKQ